MVMVAIDGHKFQKEYLGTRFSEMVVEKEYEIWIEEESLVRKFSETAVESGGKNPVEKCERRLNCLV